MSFIYIFGIIAVVAYVCQGILGFIQIKHFTKNYTELRHKGTVAIGRQPGKFRAGTIVLLALNSDGIVIEGRKIQGITVLAKFKKIIDIEGYHMFELTRTVPCVSKENKLIQTTIMDAVDVYKRVMDGEIIQEKSTLSLNIQSNLSMLKYSLQSKLKRSVNK